MEAEILTVLNEIKIAVYLLIVIVFLSVVAKWVHTWISIKDDFFTMTASSYYEENQFADLISLCEAKLAKKPNHAYALWYKAKALYQEKKYEQAKECFELLANLEPSWNESHIQPFLDLINAMGSKHPTH